MQQFCPYGSVRGALGNQRPYRDRTALDSQWRSHLRRVEVRSVGLSWAFALRYGAGRP
jgi:hypothetical protein